jgi:FkbM family methyltransferase
MQPNSLMFKLLEFYGTRMRHRGQWRVHQRLRRMLDADVRTDVEVVRRGLRWVLNPSDFVQRDVFWFGAKDTWDTFHIKRLLSPGSLIFDVGANFGYYAITLVNELGDGTRAFAFEPFPPTYARLRRNVELNALEGRVTTLALALSDAAGTAHMQTRNANSGTAALSERGDFDVAVTTMDEFCEQRGVQQLDFIKIDVEGFEDRLLRGAAQTIKRFRPLLLIELNPPVLSMNGSSVERVVEILRAYGYDLFLSRREQLVPLTSLPSGDNYVNAICLSANAR